MRNIFLSLITSTLIFLNTPFAALHENTNDDSVQKSTLTSVGGGYGFLVRGDSSQRQVMLVIDSRWPTDLNFVGGAQQKGELPHTTFEQKVAEKTGAILKKSIYLGSWQRTNANAEGANDTCCFYAGFLSENSPQPEAKQPFLNAIHWFSFEELLDGKVDQSLFPPHLHFLKHFLNNLTTMPRQLIENDFEHPETQIVYNLS